MYIRLIRNQPKGIAITGRLVIDGRWFCDTLERVGYQIPALCYPVRVTQSPKFKRLLPLVTGVPRSIVQNGVEVVQNGVELSPAEKTTLNHSTQLLNHWYSQVLEDNTEKIAAVKAIFEQLGVREACEAVVAQYTQSALEILDTLPQNTATEQLRQLANKLHTRKD